MNRYNNTPKISGKIKPDTRPSIPIIHLTNLTYIFPPWRGCSTDNLHQICQRGPKYFWASCISVWRIVTETTLKNLSWQGWFWASLEVLILFTKATGNSEQLQGRSLNIFNRLNSNKISKITYNEHWIMTSTWIIMC